jgi:hypothetical protein
VQRRERPQYAWALRDAAHTAERMMELGVQLTIQASVPASRYATDYEDMEEIGSGGFGRVVKGQHRLDGRFHRFHAVPIK